MSDNDEKPSTNAKVTDPNGCTAETVSKNVREEQRATSVDCTYNESNSRPPVYSWDCKQVDGDDGSGTWPQDIVKGCTVKDD